MIILVNCFCTVVLSSNCDLDDYSCLPPLIVLWNCDTETQFSEVCCQKMWPCFYWCRPVFLPHGDKRKSSAKHTKDLYMKRMHQSYQIFEGKNSEIALFKQASASPKYITGFIKFSPFLCDLWPNLDNSSCGWLLVWLHCNIETKNPWCCSTPNILIWEWTRVKPNDFW